jgi:hypothetical protein
MNNKFDTHMKEHFICECGDYHHMFFMNIETWNDTSPVLTIDMRLCPDKTFWGRVKTAFRYIFGLKDFRYGDFFEQMIWDDDVEKMQSVLDEYIRIRDENEAKRDEQRLRGEL